MVGTTLPDTTLDGAGDPAQQLRTAIRALVRRFSVSERAENVCCGMTVAQAATLETLATEGELRLGALGRRLGITPSTLTRNLTRLEEAGLVERRSDAGDRRAARVALSRRGRAVAGRIEAAEVRFAQSVLDHLPQPRRAPVVAALGELLGALRTATDSCCPGAYDHLMREFPRSAAEGGKDVEPNCCD